MPPITFSIGITGHRAAHAAFAEHEAAVKAAVERILDIVDDAVALSGAGHLGGIAPVRMHCLLADGTDRMAAEMAVARGYELIAPLPFGRRLNKVINAQPTTAADARALLAGGDAADPTTQSRADAMRHIADKARIFALADRDVLIRDLYLQKMDAPDDFAKAQLFAAEASRQVALAGRIVIEQSDIVIAVWDGVTTAHVGGTGHTIAHALEHNAPVLWIDPARPEDWCLLTGREALSSGPRADAGAAENQLRGCIASMLSLPVDPHHPGLAGVADERWRPRSNRVAHAYRRVEALFGGPASGAPFRSLTVHYADPAQAAAGPAAQLVAEAHSIDGADGAMGARMVDAIVNRFTWFDGVSARLSDAYRGGMIINFILSSLAIIGGIAYLPFVPPEQKWWFALFELVLLAAIVTITAIGRRRRWHKRWFETRRVAEYLRHAPLLLALGAARATGRWPAGADTSWPEFYVRQALREVGLPRTDVTPAYLRSVLATLIDRHVTAQRDYHVGKARLLNHVHHNLDRFSERLFQLAVLSVSVYLLMRLAPSFGMMANEEVSKLSKLFTVLGVAFPTLGAGIAGIRYFGDFERFAAISEVTAAKLDSLHTRIAGLLGAPDEALHYDAVAELAHGSDDIVCAEIENWQAVFGGKQISVPV